MRHIIVKEELAEYMCKFRVSLASSAAADNRKTKRLETSLPGEHYVTIGMTEIYRGTDLDEAIAAYNAA